MKTKKILTILIAAAFLFAIASISVNAETSGTQPDNSSTMQKPCGDCQGQGAMGKQGKGGKGKGKGMKMDPEDKKAMMEIRKKYKDNPEFKTMLQELKTSRDSIKTKYKADIEANRAENQKMMADFKAKMDAAKTDEEKTQIKNDFKLKIQANRDKIKKQMEPMKQDMDKQMLQIKTKYQSKFPDFFQLTEKIRAKQQAKGPKGPKGVQGAPEGTSK